MPTSAVWQSISQQIEQVVHSPFKATEITSVSGGCINSGYILQNNNNRYFVKLNQAHLLSMFEAEFSGLTEIAKTNTIKVPKPIIFSKVDEYAFLVLEFIHLKTANHQSESQLGQQLAELHKIRQPFFGWHKANTIGSTPQINTPTNQWPVFWQSKRLDFQISVAEKNGINGYLIESARKLSNSLHYLFTDHSPQPSLLHGDLWSGNAAMTKQGEAIIFDPACYYGDRETDIAMTELFGGFSVNFYSAYNESYPLDSNYSTRKTLYNLYHILNHLNLFGSSYQQQAQNMIDSLLAEIS